MVTLTERGLTPAERAEISARRDRLRADARSALPKFGAASVIVCGGLALLTLAASDAPRLVVLGFWTGMAVLFTVWTATPVRRDRRRQATVLDDALGANRARELRIQSSRVVAFDEVEDEGACYAFDAGDGRAIFVEGQQFYEGDDFPNSDFAIVEVLGSRGQPADELFVKMGARLTPERRVSAAAKEQLTLPAHLEIVPTAIDDVGR